MKSQLALCFYPTSVAFIDDSVNFVAALELAMSRRFNCITFNDPVRALNHANKINNVNWNADAKNDYTYCSDSEQFIKNTLNIPVNKINDGGRYSEISVVVVDYDMPQLDGIEFCLKLNNPNIKKILLTGQATSEKAIQAFNEGAIDYYISKADPDLHAHLTRAIMRLQNAYFLDISSYIKIRAIDNKQSLFSEPELSQYFSSILERNAIQEYYFVTNPPRYKLHDIQGKQSELLVYSRQDLNEQIRIIKEEAGPQWLVESINSGGYVPYFRTEDGFYAQENFDGDNSLYEADIIKGKEETFYCAHIKNTTLPFRPMMPPSKNQSLH